MTDLSRNKVPFDVIEIEISLMHFPAEMSDDEMYLITQAVFINGENIAPDRPIDLRQLAKSCQLSGEFFIVTCGCGFPETDDGIRVTHQPDRIVWQVPELDSFSEEEQDAHNPIYRTYVFCPEQYLEAVQGGLCDAKSFLFSEYNPIECSPYGFEREDLLALDPLVFSERGAPLGCQLLARHIEVESGFRAVIMNGIRYRLNELPVPDDIKALGDWSEWEPKAVDGGFIYGSLAAPSEEVRRRTRIFTEYLASVQSSGGVVSNIDE